MNLAQLVQLFGEAGAIKLYAKPLSENDNSKNQIYFAGAVETLNVFPSHQILAENTNKGPSFKAQLNFGWLSDAGQVASAPGAQLILYSQYPEVRFSGFLKGCKAAPNQLMLDRERAKTATPDLIRQLAGRILFLGVTSDRRVLGYVAPGNSQIAMEFHARSFPLALAVFREIPLSKTRDEANSRIILLEKLRQIHQHGWIVSKQLDSHGQLKPCNAQQCGGYTLEAELGIAKNSAAEPDYLGWEVKQYAVDDFDHVESSKPITLMTPEPTGGFYKEHDIRTFIRKFGYADRMGRTDRLNFGGRHFVNTVSPATGLMACLRGYDTTRGSITDANGCLALVNPTGEVAAEWSFSKLLEHWSHKHMKAVYVPSRCRKEPRREYFYGNKIRLMQMTDGLRLLKALATGVVYYDPGIKLEQASSENPSSKKRSQFRAASSRISALYETTETIDVTAETWCKTQ